MRRYFGVIEFLDSTREGRHTTVCEFGVISDWFGSVKEFHQQAANAGDFDGTEILINVYEYHEPYPRDGAIHSYDISSENLVSSVSIGNPYYV